MLQLSGRKVGQSVWPWYWSPVHGCVPQFESALKPVRGKNVVDDLGSEFVFAPSKELLVRIERWYSWQVSFRDPCEGERIRK